MTLSELSPLLWLHRQPAITLFAGPHLLSSTSLCWKFLHVARRSHALGLDPKKWAVADLLPERQAGTWGQARPSPACGVSSILAQSPVDGPPPHVPQNCTLTAFTGISLDLVLRS